MSYEDFALHAWVDESMHVDAGLYLLAAVVCDAQGCAPYRTTLLSLLDTEQPKLHWGAESPERKAKIIDTVSQFDLTAAVVIGAPMNKKKQERARAVCMESLAVALAGMGVTQVYLEERTPSLNARDTKLIDSLRSKQLIPKELRIDVAQPSTEPMLWLPDIVAGAVGSDRVRNKPEYLDAIRSMVEEIEVELR